MNTPHLGRGLAVVFCCALAALGGAAHAADVLVGKVVAVRGDVVAQTGSERTPLVLDMQVRTGMVIVAGSGKARLELVDGTLVTVGENSQVQVPAIASGTGASTRVALISGALRLLVVKATPQARFEVETETAIAAVRGTDWAVEATRATTGVVVLEGSVDVTSRGRVSATVHLARPRDGTDVRAGSAPTPPAPWGEPRLAALLARTTL